jgi:hypothetical protein
MCWRKISPPSSGSKNKLFVPLAFKLVSCSAYFRPWRCGRYIPLESRLTFNGLHRDISQIIPVIRKYALSFSEHWGIFFEVASWYARRHGSFLLIPKKQLFQRRNIYPVIFRLFRNVALQHKILCVLRCILVPSIFLSCVAFGKPFELLPQLNLF